jgi:hypothetical protein
VELFCRFVTLSFRRILFHCFYQWRSLQLERSKEMKKKKWREKVWEVLPDYKPPTDEDYI